MLKDLEEVAKSESRTKNELPLSEEMEKLKFVKMQRKGEVRNILTP